MSIRCKDSPQGDKLNHQNQFTVFDEPNVLRVPRRIYQNEMPASGAYNLVLTPIIEHL